MYRLIPLLLLFTITLSHADMPPVLDSARQTMTEYFHDLLHTIDDTIDCEANCTHPEIERVRANKLHLITSLQSTENHRLSLSLNLRGNIYLPKLSKKFRITFTKQSNTQQINREVDRENENLITDNKLRIGVQYIITSTKKVEFFTRLGIRLRNPLDFYQEVSARKTFALYKEYGLLTKGSLYYYITHLYLAKSLQFTFFKPLSERYYLTQGNEWYSNSDNRHERHLVNYLKLHQHLDLRNHLEYWITYASLAQNSTSYKEDWHALSLSYIHHFSKWYYLRITPRLVQKREHRFRTQYEATLSFGMILGK
ncbi:MAG TPA: hypothetical protein ENK97_03290 [Campylobacteraceae bacterium]|nr:hypothetical protein [Campylobacteraceae bacterium]